MNRLRGGALRGRLVLGLWVFGGLIAGGHAAPPLRGFRAGPPAPPPVDEKFSEERYQRALLRLTHQDVAKRLEAIREFHAMKLVSSSTRLTARFVDPDFSVRIAAVTVVAELDPPEAVRAAEGLWPHAPLEVRHSIAYALGQMRDPPVAMLTLAANDSEKSIRRAAIQGLWRAGRYHPCTDAALALAGMTRDPDPGLVEAAVRAMTDYQELPPEAIPALSALLDTGSGPSRELAVLALGKIDSPDTLKPLGIALGNQDIYTRRNAVKALGRMKSPQAVTLLMQALGDADEQVRSYVVASMIGFHDSSAVPFWDRVVTMGEFAREAVNALDSPALGSGRLPLLQQLLGHSEAHIRRQAARALWLGGDASCIPALKQALGDSDEHVRRFAREGLDALGEGKGEVFRPRK